MMRALKGDVKDYDLVIASGVFVSDGIAIQKSYANDSITFYDSKLYSAVFRDNPEEAMQDLNAWVQDNTNDKIKRLIERPLPSATPMVFLNAVYFKGNWMTIFDPEDTRPGKFYGLTRVSDVDMMYQEGTYFYIETPEYQAVEIPYKSEEVVITILLPKDPKGIHTLEQSVDFTELREKLSAVIKQKVRLTLPKFKLSETYDMRGALQNLGLNRVFDPKYADMTGLSVHPRLAVDSIIHRALIEVNENGTTAIAVTAGINKHSLPSPQVAVFTADRPFLFFIEDTTTEFAMFLGRVANLDKS